MRGGEASIPEESSRPLIHFAAYSFCRTEKSAITPCTGREVTSPGMRPLFPCQATIDRGQGNDSAAKRESAFWMVFYLYGSVPSAPDRCARICISFYKNQFGFFSPMLVVIATALRMVRNFSAGLDGNNRWESDTRLNFRRG